MRRAGAVTLVVLMAALFQTSFLPFLAFNGFRPDLLVLVTIAFALHDGPIPGLAVGFGAGILTDLLLNSSPIGLTALVYLGIAFATGLLKPYVPPDSVSAPLFVGAAGTLVGVAGYGVLGMLLGEADYSFGLVVRSAFVSSLYALLLTPIVMGAVRWLARVAPPEVRAATP